MADWKDELSSLFQRKEEQAAVDDQGIRENRRAAAAWFETHARPAYEEIAQRLQLHGRVATVSIEEAEAGITVKHNGKLELSHRIVAHPAPHGTHLELKGRSTDRKDGKTYGWSGMLTGSSQTSTVEKATKSDVIAKFMEDYKNHLS